ncbi:inosine/xanthosine triphosphatase [Pontibacter sp. MBLB2868]|uniref:inosine/xanthosine triphosphatase n=1 Tax=Pontibacter sp. MBLB2868 TaxID=3451555 RepID=UPI003F756EB8
MMKKVFTVVVASKNPVKMAAAKAGLQRMFPEQQFKLVPVSVPSGVADQPMSDEETLQGALNRVQNAAAAMPEADYWIGLEGGVSAMYDELAAFAWIVVWSPNCKGRARSGTFFLPKAVSVLVEQGVELGVADDMVFSRKNSKQAGGAIGLLTDNVLDRKALYEQAVMLALVPFKNADLYAGATQPAST